MSQNATTDTIARKQFPNEVLLAQVAHYIKEGRSVTLTVRGNSMNPFLTDGRDQVTLSPFTEEELKPGAVILARESGGRMLLHRIISRQGEVLTMLGDGNVLYTEQTCVSDVIGILTKIIRKGKEHACNGRTWQWYSTLWIKLRPIRKELLILFRILHRYK